MLLFHPQLFSLFVGECSGFVCPFCADRIEDKNQKTVSNHDIVSHLKCHENKSFQCVKCNAFFASDTSALNHILLQHSNDAIKYFHNRVAMGLETVTVQLGCNICGMIFKTSDQAVDHFENNHNAQRIDLNAVPSIETTKYDMQTDWAVGRFSWNIRQQFHCNKCDRTEGTIPELLIHHNKEHPLKPIVAKRGQTLVAHNDDKNWQSNILYGCVHCKDGTENPNLLFDSVNAVYLHWQENHTKAPNFKPFHFCIVNFVACFYCNRISTFDDMQTHHKKRHSKEPFVVVDVNSRRKCGICQDGFEDMAKHFIESHTKTLDRIVVSNPIRLNCEQLSKILSFKVHKRMKCGHCDEAFDCNAELRTHWTARHPDEKTKIHSFFNDDRIRIILDCCREEFDRSQLGKHFVEHDFRFHCTICGFVTKKLRRILRHDKEQHVETYDAQRRINNFAKKLKNYYLNGIIIFGNGFVANGFNLRNTTFDDTQLIDDFVSKFQNHESD